MLEQKKYFYQFLNQDFVAVKQALQEVWAKKEKVFSLNIPVMSKLYNYLEPIYRAVLNEENSFTANLDRALIKLIPITLLKRFIIQPDDKQNRDELSYVIVLIHAALNNLRFTPIYTLDEVEKATNTDLLYYDDVIMVHTLAKVQREFTDFLKIGSYLQFFVKYFQNNGGAEFKEQMEWEPALQHVQLMNLFWEHFVLLKKEMQEILLKNYFYIAIVCGVPVKNILERFLSVGAEEELNTRRQMFFEALQSSREEVPLDANFTEWKKLIEVIKAFSVRIKGANSGFEQEEFLKTFYNNQEGRDVYRGWLREVLNIVFSLEK